MQNNISCTVYLFLGVDRIVVRATISLSFHLWLVKGKKLFVSGLGAKYDQQLNFECDLMEGTQYRDADDS